ncbi:MAG: S46 family peptidase, partial [Bacteroidales bacterium]
DEGMWLLPLIETLNMEAMEGLGCELTAEQIYSINNSSIKDAIVIFGGGCTGEIVSEQGLLFTNHHCGYDEIQNHSTVGNDILKDGFWAGSKEKELPNPDLEVKFLVRVENVTGRILQQLTEDMVEEERREQIQDMIEEITEEASQEERFEAEVKPFFAGNKYYLFVYEVFRDVRLVGTPPSAIGKFGYDSDNWMWPRHTGDFSIFRVYTAPDGSPAEYNPENIPLKPKHFLPISLGGINNGDFTLVMGYPGETDRYLNSYGIIETMEVINENRIKIRDVRQEILLEDMLMDPEIRIKYAVKYSRSSNYWKYSIGQNKGLRRLNIIEKKRNEENEFRKWVRKDSSRMKLYGSVLHDLREIYEEKRPHVNNFYFLSEAFFRASEIVDFISEFHYLYMLLLVNEDGDEEIKQETEELKKMTENFFDDYSMDTDIKVTRAMIELYQNSIPLFQHPDFYSTIHKKYNEDIGRYVEKLFAKTFFIDKSEVMEFLDEPNLKDLSKDFGFQTSNSIFKKYYEEYLILDDYGLQLEKLERLYMQGRIEMDSDKISYPDANSTIRLTYGTVKDYFPRDAVHYDYYTSLKGVMEKEDSMNFEFIVPDKLKKLYVEKNYGRYTEEGRLPVCFITNNDITGGNSGSPVLNKKGELIGLAFDGNWEAMSGDIAFEPELQRCICVDIRYVLFIIDKFADAGQLLEELKLVH